MNVTIYVNGKHVTKEELSKYEVTNERAKQILREAIKRKNKPEIKG